MFTLFICFIHTFAYLSYLFIQFIHTFISPFPCSLLTSLSLLCSLPTSLSPSLVPSLPCSLPPSLHYLPRCTLLLTGKLLSSLLCCELTEDNRWERNIHSGGMVTLLYPLIICQSVSSGYSHSSWLFEVADTTLSGAVTMVTNKLQLNVQKYMYISIKKPVLQC